MLALLNQIFLVFLVLSVGISLILDLIVPLFALCNLALQSNFEGLFLLLFLNAFFGKVKQLIFLSFKLLLLILDHLDFVLQFLLNDQMLIS
jgi:hypothetical protein